MSFFLCILFLNRFREGSQSTYKLPPHCRCEFIYEIPDVIRIHFMLMDESVLLAANSLLSFPGERQVKKCWCFWIIWESRWNMSSRVKQNRDRGGPPCRPGLSRWWRWEWRGEESGEERNNSSVEHLDDGGGGRTHRAHSKVGKPGT